MATEYETNYIIRFRGTLTHGPNAGKSCGWADSWGGVLFSTEQEARDRLVFCRELEPGIEFRLLSRQFVAAGREGRFVESEVPAWSCITRQKTAHPFTPNRGAR